MRLWRPPPQQIDQYRVGPGLVRRPICPTESKSGRNIQGEEKNRLSSISGICTIVLTEIATRGREKEGVPACLPACACMELQLCLVSAISHLLCKGAALFEWNRSWRQSPPLGEQERTGRTLPSVHGAGVFGRAEAHAGRREAGATHSRAACRPLHLLQREKPSFSDVLLLNAFSPLETITGLFPLQLLTEVMDAHLVWKTLLRTKAHSWLHWNPLFSHH